LHYQPNKLIITIDGPAGAGKSTVASMLAKKLGFRYINTGDLYRYVTYSALQEKVDISNRKAMENLSKKIVDQFTKENYRENSWQLFFNRQKAMLYKIHSPEIDKNVSFVAQLSSVRKNMVPLQRMLAKGGSVVMEGRDIGSVILPNADLKFFLTADKHARILRRYEELKEKGYSISLQEVREEIIKRDNIDSKRKVAPLIKPEDAVIIDTSNKNINEVFKTLLKIVKKHSREN
jgi:CMP/dCMP kinase